MMRNDLRKIYTAPMPEGGSYEFFTAIRSVPLTQVNLWVDQILNDPVLFNQKFNPPFLAADSMLKQLKKDCPYNSMVQDAKSFTHMKVMIKEHHALEKLKILDRHGVFASSARSGLPVDIATKIVTEHYHKPNFGL